MATRARREWKDSEKAAALAALTANGGNIRKTARETGVPEATVRAWSKHERINADVPAIADLQKVSLADELERLALKLIGVADKKAEDATVAQAMTGAGIAIDKMQLLRGKPTERNGVVDETFDDDERLDRLTALLDLARERRARLAAEGGKLTTPPDEDTKASAHPDEG